MLANPVFFIAAKWYNQKEMQNIHLAPLEYSVKALYGGGLAF